MLIINKPNKIIIMFGASHYGGGGLKPVSHPLGCALGKECNVLEQWWSNFFFLGP
jgi:hypothetical protein